MQLICSFLMILMITHQMNSACAEGTLQCTTEDTSTICDFSKGYALNEAGDGCEKKTVDGCAMIGIPGDAKKCLLCNPNYVYDTATNVCTEVPQESVVENCETYSVSGTTFSCITCKSGNVLDDSACAGVPEANLIENCESYTKAGEVYNCSGCQNKFVLKDNACTEIANLVDNCYAHTDRRCTSCDSGYTLNRAKPVQIFINTDFYTQLLSAADKMVLSQETVSADVCQKVTVKNCSDLKDFEKCSTCDYGYFLNSSELCELFPEDPLDKCVKYSSATTCMECDNGFYTNAGNSFTCSASTADENCTTFKSDDDGCNVCASGFYNNTSSVCTTRTNEVDNCDELNPNADNCLTCKSGFLATNDNLACKEPPANCPSTNVNTGSSKDDDHTCVSSCEVTHILSGALCATARSNYPIDGCQSYDAEADECSVCHNNKYLADNKLSCPAIDIEFCDSPHLTQNECTTCQSLYYPSGSTCAEISDKANCVRSDGQNDDCSMCVVGYYKDVSSKCTQTRDTANVDSNCAGNNSDEENANCDECANTHVLFNSKTKLYSSVDNCVRVNSTTGVCIQCAENFVLNGSDTCDEFTGDANTQICLKKFPTFTSPLTETTDCVVCNSALNKYKDGTTCLDITSSKLWEGCDDVLDSNGTCESCSADYTLVGIDQFTCSTVAGMSTALTGCLVHSDSSTCELCGTGYTLNAGTCDVAATNTTKLFDYSGNLVSYVEAVTDPVVDNCKTYAQIDEDTFACIECNDSFLAIIGDLTASNTATFVRSAYFGTEGPNHSLYNTIVSCLTEGGDTAPVRVGTAANPSNSYVAAAGCAVALSVPADANKFCCIQCKETKSGPFLASTDGTNDGFRCLRECDPISDIATAGTKKGIGYHSRTETASVQANHLVFDYTCGTPGNKPFVHGQVDTTNVLGFNLSSYVHLVLFLDCEDPSLYAVSNCRMYSYKEGEDITGISSFDATANHAKMGCLVCEPGYVLDSSDNTCDQIPTSECADGGDWLGACKTPAATHAYAFDNINKIPVYHFLIDVSAKTSNCVLASTFSSLSCLICDQGYSVTSTGECEQMFTDTTYCATSGAGSSSLTGTTSLSVVGAMALNVAKYSGKNSMICDSCASGKFAMQKKWETTGTNTNYVSTTKCALTSRMNLLTALTAPTVANCAVSNLDDTGAEVAADKCLKCEAGHFASANSCALITAVTNCAEYSSATACSKCGSGHYLVDATTCTPTNCLEWENDSWLATGSDECLICKPDHKLTVDGSGDVDKYTCTQKSAQEITDDTCETYSPKNGICVKCKTANHYPVLYSSDNWKCVSMDLSGSAYINYGSYLYFDNNRTVNYIGPTATISYSNNVNNVVTAAMKDLEYNYPASTPPSNAVCFPKATDSNCNDTSDDVESSLYCRNCGDGYFFNSSTFMCDEITLTGCKVADVNQENCTTCVDDTASTSYYLSGTPAVCTARTNDWENCVTKDSAKDECTSCDSSTRYLNSSTKQCTQGTAAHQCATFEENEDACASCPSGHWKDTTASPVVCKAYDNAANCKEGEWSSTKDECEECMDNYYETTVGTLKKCNLNSDSNCLVSVTDADSCTTCKPNYKTKDTDGIVTCEAVEPVDNCKADGDNTYNTNTNNCKVCNDGYYKYNSGEECRLYPDGISNCSMYTDRTTCTACKNNFYLNSNACTAVEAADQVTGCTSYSSATQCASCEGGKWLKNNECVAITATGCALYTDEATCDLCFAGYVKDENNANCVDGGITNCNVVIKGSPNTCETCQPGSLPNEAGTACVTVTPAIPNCHSYESTTLCKQCTGNNMLALDKKSCVDPTTSLGPNCGLGEFTATKVCDMCYPGFKFDAEGACAALEMPGCALEDVSTNKCMMCMSGYYMNKELECTEIKTDDDDDISVGIMSNLAMVTLLTLLMNKLF